MVVGSTIRWTLSTFDTTDTLFNPTSQTLTVTKGDGVDVTPTITTTTTPGIHEATYTSVVGDEGEWEWVHEFSDSQGNVLVHQDVFRVLPRLN